MDNYNLNNDINLTDEKIFQQFLLFQKFLNMQQKMTSNTLSVSTDFRDTPNINTKQVQELSINAATNLRNKQPEDSSDSLVVVKQDLGSNLPAENYKTAFSSNYLTNNNNSNPKPTNNNSIHLEPINTNEANLVPDDELSKNEVRIKPVEKEKEKERGAFSNLSRKNKLLKE